MERDHLFISYAWEDAHLADWLTLKLTAQGYKVWCDRHKLIGGCRWPDDIDEAIKKNTFRMIHLLSTHSLNKDNPKKERQLALSISKERKENFLIPLNIDGVPNSDIPWQLSDIQYIFFRNWADGFKSLLKTLEESSTPRFSVEEGAKFAIDAALPPRVLQDVPEVLISNLLEVTAIPLNLQRFRIGKLCSETELESLSLVWAFYKIKDRDVLALSPPPPQIQVDYKVSLQGGSLWQSVHFIDGIKSLNVVKSLIKKSFIVACCSRRLRFDPRYSHLYFVPKIVEKDQIKFTSYSGRRTRVSVIGQRRSGASKFQYALGLQPLLAYIEGVNYIQIRLRPKIFESGDKPLSSRRILQRRKKLAKSWWNHQWLLRQLGIRSFIFGDNTEIKIGTPGNEIVFSCKFKEFEIPVGIKEEELRAIKPLIPKPLVEEDDIEEEIELTEVANG